MFILKKVHFQFPYIKRDYIYSRLVKSKNLRSPSSTPPKYPKLYFVHNPARLIIRDDGI